MKEDKKVFDCAVIGGGAAGMCAAVFMARCGLKTIIIESTKKIGTKILQTGNGKCNFTNIKMDNTCYQNEDTYKVMSVIDKFDNKKTIEFFESLGVYHRERNGYVYPHSDTAASLQNALKMEIEHLKVRVSTDFQTQNIVYKDDVYNIISDTYTYFAKTVLIATGSKAAVKLPESPTGYELAEKNGHKIVKPLPALVQLISSDKECRMMAGVRSQGTVELYIDGKLSADDIGELQFTDYGLSGIPVFQISRFAVKAIDEKKTVKLCVDMIPDYDAIELEKICFLNIEKCGYKTFEQYFEGLVNKKLVGAVANRAGIKTGDSIKDIGIEKIKKCLWIFKHFEMKITGFKGFESAQICQGGVSLDNVDMDTMMSKIQPGVFFAGEILDVDGKCGGYNLQWAWSSANVAANAIEKYIENQKKGA